MSAPKCQWVTCVPQHLRIDLRIRICETAHASKGVCRLRCEQRSKYEYLYTLCKRENSARAHKLIWNLIAIMRPHTTRSAREMRGSGAGGWLGFQSITPTVPEVRARVRRSTSHKCANRMRTDSAQMLPAIMANAAEHYTMVLLLPNARMHTCNDAIQVFFSDCSTMRTYLKIHTHMFFKCKCKVNAE